MDIWGPVTPPTTYGQHFNTFLAAKRGLYIALHDGPRWDESPAWEPPAHERR